MAPAATLIISHRRRRNTKRAAAMKEAMADAGITPDDVGYINAHGTSTKYNDYFETLAIKKYSANVPIRYPVSSTNP